MRRDVYMRMANLVKVLNDDLKSWWTLVLPPWSRLYHWRSNVIQQQIPWATFFDIDSLSRHVPVMEFVDFLNGISEFVVSENHYDIYLHINPIFVTKTKICIIRFARMRIFKLKKMKTKQN